MTASSRRAISKAALVDFLRQVRPALLKVLAGQDPSLQYLLEATKADKSKVLIDRIDTSGDGTISLEEFVEFFVPNSAAELSEASQVQRRSSIQEGLRCTPSAP